MAVTRVVLSFNVESKKPLSREFIRKLKKAYMAQPERIYEPIWELGENDDDTENLIDYVAVEGATFRVEKVS